MHELAWAAGFFDGEGHAGRNSKTGQYMVHVSQIDRLVLDRFKDALGFGKVYGPYDSEHGKPRWVYQTGSFQHAQAVCAMLWKYLSPVKRNQFKTVLRGGEA